MKCTETHCYLKLGKKWLLVIVLHPLVHSYRTHDNCKELSWCLSIWQVECKGTGSWNFISMSFCFSGCHLHLHSSGSFCDQECSVNIYMLRTVYIDFMIVISYYKIPWQPFMIILTWSICFLHVRQFQCTTKVKNFNQVLLRFVHFVFITFDLGIC